MHARTTLLKPPNNLGLVGYWSFNDGTGTIATDFSGRGNTGTLTGGPTWVNGKRGKGIGFDGGGDWINVSDVNTLGIVHVFRNDLFEITFVKDGVSYSCRRCPKTQPPPSTC